MAFEEFRMRLAMLLDEIAANPHDAHELQESLREKLAEMQGLGLPLPDDLTGLEAYLEADLARPAAEGEDDDDPSAPDQGPTPAGR